MWQVLRSKQGKLSLDVLCSMANDNGRYVGGTRLLLSSTSFQQRRDVPHKPTRANTTYTTYTPHRSLTSIVSRRYFLSVALLRFADALEEMAAGFLARLERPAPMQGEADKSRPRDRSARDIVEREVAAFTQASRAGWPRAYMACLV